MLFFILVDKRILVLCILEIINFHLDTQQVFYICLIKHDLYSLRRKQNKYTGRIYKILHSIFFN